MPSVAYLRRDWLLSVATNQRGVSLMLPGLQAELALTNGELNSWARGRAPRLVNRIITDVVALGDLGPMRYGAGQAGQTLLPRLAVSTDEQSAGFPWEDMLRKAAGRSDIATCRVSPVPPSGLELPLSLPARLLQVGMTGRSMPSMVAAAAAMNHPLDHHEVRNVLRAEAVDVGDLADWRRDAGWPTIDVVHLAVPDLDRKEDRLSAAHPDVPGTFGWLRRLMSTAGTRLLVLDCMSDRADEVRRLAAAIVAAGGPAVVVAPSHAPLGLFYAQLVHDRPVDAAAAIAQAGKPRARDGLAVFGGGGREELLRFSQVAEQLLEVAQAARAEPKTANRLDIAELDELAPRSHQLKLADAIEDLIGRRMVVWEFENQERKGVLPLGNSVEKVRSTVGLGREGPARPAPSFGPRFVNSRFQYTATDGRPTGVVDDKPMVVGDRHVLAVEIGPRAGRPSLRATALLEEVMKWAPDDDGRFVEIGVTGLDFDVAGSPVQELWVPRDAPSDPVFFAVTPRRAGAAVLRFSMFVDHNVVQSFRVGALTVDADQPDPDEPLLARLLGVDPAELEGSAWRSRMEFSMAGSEAGFLDERRAALSIVANDRDGGSVITVKGGDVFNVATSVDLARMVRDVRNALSDIATPPTPGVLKEHLAYAFATDDDHLNAGTEEALAASLKSLAGVGWALFDQVFAGADRAKLAQATQASGGVIRVAHVLLEKVIPWAALYDREYDVDRKKIGALAVEHTACLAALPDADGVMADVKCGQLPACKLHRNNLPPGLPPNQRHRYASVVACPRHLWGFRHRIELPAGQVDADTPAPLPDRVQAAHPPRLGVGMHAGLVRHERHLQELAALVAPAWTAYDPDDVKDHIVDDLEIDLVYLYCHAEGGAETGIEQPSLRFKAVDGQEGKVRPEHLGGAAWPHHPVVIVNGCHTAAFSCDALSPFIRKLTRDRAAGGVLGTEISVWEPLATYFGIEFVSGMLRTLDAGDAVLAARRGLLAKRNPLGLAYTLYARSDLRLAP